MFELRQETLILTFELDLKSPASTLIFHFTISLQLLRPLQNVNDMTDAGDNDATTVQIGITIG